MAANVERLERADEVARGGGTQPPDASRVLLAITPRQLGEIGVRFLHQERGARGRAGVSQQEAEKRVDDGYTQAQQAADTARKAVAHAMYWTFLALLVGAFCASFAATIGGRERDRVPAI
jgi:hypothetical protein